MAWTSPRTWTTGEVVTASIMNTHVRDNFSALERSFQVPSHVSGLYYTPQVVELIEDAVSANNLLGMPIFIPNSGSYDRIGFRTATANSGNVRLGIYNDNGGVPGARILDAGAVSVTSGGIREITISQALTGPGIYWLAFLADSNLGAGLIKFAGGAGVFNYDPSADLLYSGVYKTGVSYGALPDPYGAIVGRFKGPLLLLRRV